MVKKQWSTGRISKIVLNKGRKVRCLEVTKPDGTVVFRDVRNVCKLEVDLSE